MKKFPINRHALLKVLTLAVMISSSLQACEVLNCLTCSKDPNVCLMCTTGFSNQNKKTASNKAFSICKKNGASWWGWLIALLTLGGLGALGYWLFKKYKANQLKKKLPKKFSLPHETQPTQPADPHYSNPHQHQNKHK